MITINLNKMESALEQVRKSFPKLLPTDAAHLTTAIVLAGRHAKAVYHDQTYSWPEDVERLTEAMLEDLIDSVKTGDGSGGKKSKTVEEEPLVLHLDLVPNMEAAERQLEGREDLQALLSDAMQEGLEFNIQAHDVGWQWALERVNWHTLSGGELNRRVKIRTVFGGGASGVEMSKSGAVRKRGSKSK
ncbi:MAG: hypothetical protein WHU10_02380 [Fimbriimonadales bacterium]